jgi:hypothetical protein
MVELTELVESEYVANACLVELLYNPMYELSSDPVTDAARLVVVEPFGSVEVILPDTVIRPELAIRIASVGDDAPSAVVENTRRPGISLAPGVPST